MDNHPRIFLSLADFLEMASNRIFINEKFLTASSARVPLEHQISYKKFGYLILMIKETFHHEMPQVFERTPFPIAGCHF